MEKIPNPLMREAIDPYIKEGMDDYLEEKEDSLDFISKDRIFEGTYEDLKNIFSKLISGEMKHNFESDWECHDFLVYEFKRIIEGKVIEGDFSGLVKLGKELMMEHAGFDALDKLDSSKAADALLVAEAINLSAKIATDYFYMLKPALIVASAKLGAQIGAEFSDSDWPIYYLFEKNSGVASFHDPGDEVYDLLKAVDEDIEIREWEFGWSGVRRQDLAYDLISEKEKLFMQRMRYSTLPGENAEEKRKLLDVIEEKYSI